jgi:transcription antitermination factor NusG
MVDSQSFDEKYFNLHWYAAYTCPRHEKRIADQLTNQSLEHFLPLYTAVHRWKNGRALVQLPLFPGYVFVRIALKNRLQILEVPSVVRLVGFNSSPTPLDDAEMNAMRAALENGVTATPYRYLTAGKRVRIKNGPLEGLEGIVIYRKGKLRVVISIEMIMRSMAVDIEAADLEVVQRSRYDLLAQTGDSSPRNALLGLQYR